MSVPPYTPVCLYVLYIPMAMVMKCCVVTCPLFFLYWWAICRGNCSLMSSYFFSKIWTYINIHTYLYACIHVYSCTLEVFSNLNERLIQAVCKWTADAICEVSGSDSCLEWTSFHFFFNTLNMPLRLLILITQRICHRPSLEKLLEGYRK